MLVQGRTFEPSNHMIVAINGNVLTVDNDFETTFQTGATVITSFSCFSSQVTTSRPSDCGSRPY